MFRLEVQSIVIKIIKGVTMCQYCCILRVFINSFIGFCEN